MNITWTLVVASILTNQQWGSIETYPYLDEDGCRKIQTMDIEKADTVNWASENKVITSEGGIWRIAECKMVVEWEEKK